MISVIEIYLSHVVAKDFPLPKAIRLMYEEYKNSNKAWEKIYDEDQDYIGELNDKILDLEFKIKKQQKEIEARLEEIDILYKMMSVKDDEIKYLEIKLEQYGEEYQILKDDIEGHRIAYVDTPEFEENYISKDKIKGKIEELKKEKLREEGYSAVDIIEKQKIKFALDVLYQLYFKLSGE